MTEFYPNWDVINKSDKEAYIKTELILLLIRYISLRSSNKTLSDKIVEYLKERYGSVLWLVNSWNGTYALDSVKEIRMHITNYFGKIGVLRHLESNEGLLFTCTCGDLIFESLFALGYEGEDHSAPFTRDISLALGSYTESIFYNILSSVLEINLFRPNSFSRFRIKRWFYSVDGKDYEIDFIVLDTISKKRLFIDTKGNKHIMTPSMGNIQDYDKDKDIVIILANEYKPRNSENEYVEVDKRFNIEYLTYEDFLLDYVEKWKEDCCKINYIDIEG